MRSDDVVLTGRVANWSVAKRARLVVAVAMSGVLGGCGPVGGVSPGASVGPSPQPSPAAFPSLPTDGELAIGQTALTLDGVDLSFEVPSAGWTTSTYAGGRTVDKDLVEPADGLPDGASIFFWAPSPSQTYTDPCRQTLGPEVGPSAADLAAAVSKVPGTDAVGPSDVTFGGRQAKSVVLTIREDVGCDPGSFYLWAAGGSYRYATALGDEIQVWVVDVDGWRGMIEAETRMDASPETKADLQRLIESIHFD